MQDTTRCALQIGLPRDWANLALYQGGGQLVLSCEQCFVLYQVFLSFLRLPLGAKVLSFACSSPAGGMLFGVSNNNNNRRLRSEWPFIIINLLLPYYTDGQAGMTTSAFGGGSAPKLQNAGYTGTVRQ